MKNQDTKDKTCSISRASMILGDFWSLLIVKELLKGEMRFNDLEESIGDITSSTLSTKLKKLEAEGVVHREQYTCIPPKVIYSLTPKGLALKSVLDEIQSYGDTWC